MFPTTLMKGGNNLTEKKLYRSRNKKMLGGVCGGLSEYLGLDATVIRLLWAASVIFAGFGILLYLICWLIIPEEPYYTIS